MVGEANYKDGQEETAVCWFRDAGKFQSMMDSLVVISVGDRDFTCICED